MEVFNMKNEKNSKTIKNAQYKNAKKNTTDTPYDRWSDGGGAIAPPKKTKR